MKTECTPKNNMCESSQGTSCSLLSTRVEATTNPGETTSNQWSTWWYTCWTTTTCPGAISRRTVTSRKGPLSLRTYWDSDWKSSTLRDSSPWFQVRLFFIVFRGADKSAEVRSHTQIRWRAQLRRHHSPASQVQGKPHGAVPLSSAPVRMDGNPLTNQCYI